MNAKLTTAKLVDPDVELAGDPAAQAAAEPVTPTTPAPVEKTEKVEPAEDDFNLENLRLDQSFLETSVKKLLVTIPVRRPSNQDYIRVNPNPAYRGNFANFGTSARFTSCRRPLHAGCPASSPMPRSTRRSTGKACSFSGPSSCRSPMAA
jgi:hypothetical protein